MFTKAFALVVFSVAVFGCGLSIQQNAKQTLAGIDQQQALIAAQHTLAEEGVDVEEISFEKGELQSIWQKKNKKQIQYKVTVEPKKDTGITTVVVTVSAQSRDKVVGGWSDPVPAANVDIDDLLEDIVSLAVSRYEPGATAPQADIVETQAISTPPAPSYNCVTATDCPEGNYCEGGKCTSDCRANDDCEAGKQCDHQGKCVDMPISIKPAAFNMSAGSDPLSVNLRKEGQL